MNALELYVFEYYIFMHKGKWLGLFQWVYTMTEPRHSYKGSCKYSPKITRKCKFSREKKK